MVHPTVVHPSGPLFLAGKKVCGERRQMRILLRNGKTFFAISFVERRFRMTGFLKQQYINSSADHSATSLVCEEVALNLR